jgi:Glycosyl transferases group 1
MEANFLWRFEELKAIASFGYIGSGNPWNVRCIEGLDHMVQTRPNIDWALAGSITKLRLLLKSNPHMIGVVASPSDFYEIVECVVNPMIGGTGLKIKTVEALSFGKPVIGTVAAFAGIQTDHEAHKLQDVSDCVDCMHVFKSERSFAADLKVASRKVFLEYAIRVNDQIQQLCSVFARV